MDRVCVCQPPLAFSVLHKRGPTLLLGSMGNNGVTLMASPTYPTPLISN